MGGASGVTGAAAFNTFHTDKLVPNCVLCTAPAYPHWAPVVVRENYLYVPSQAVHCHTVTFM